MGKKCYICGRQLDVTSIGKYAVLIIGEEDEHIKVCTLCRQLVWAAFDTVRRGRSCTTHEHFELKKYFIEELKRGNYNILYICDWDKIVENEPRLLSI